MGSTSKRQLPLSSSSSSSSRAASGQGNAAVRSKTPASRRSVTPNSRVHSNEDDSADSGRVRVAVRLRPRNADDLLSDADFADCVELQPEMRRLKLRKNNWSSESYRFDEVFMESASQRHVYEVVAKPVVESVLNGYNGTVMAYGQTGTGKTYTLGRLGNDDASERGIMVRALEDIIANTSPTSDSVEISYLQVLQCEPVDNIQYVLDLSLAVGSCCFSTILVRSILQFHPAEIVHSDIEWLQDLLAPEKINIPITEDPRTGKYRCLVLQLLKFEILTIFYKQLQIGEANRHAANTKLNTESSRSHAILMVYVRRSVHKKVEDEISSQEKVNRSDVPGGSRIPIVRKSKLLIVDLAGSERVDKSGSEGQLLEEAKFINLSLTSLGKCINALAENSPHIPIRDSKLTRLLRDSFGGSARTSLIITIGPSARHHAETTSTIMFGQRAMKIVNMVKLKEEFDYESLCRKLEKQVDQLTEEIERQQKKNLVTRSEFLEKENTRLELEMKDFLNELNHQKDLNVLMRDEVASLEMSLKHSKIKLAITMSVLPCHIVITLSII
ncbi:Kinesin-like protein KIN-UC [Vitis vinifera]|uniref:Kinesin-like protein n=1 Tax=Vitis vinifera TaxID=29760 RepID=A0A438IM14_VITVI|nr:Kinesin-like protein KIN-UC [Vitis vinifera]